MGCGAILANRWQKIYCSNACQQLVRKSLLLKAWLETGIATPGSHARHYIREHLAREQEGRCAICRRPAEWEGQPLTLVLDHVDGNADNNVRENLRLVCPNCDSQLPTYKSRNRGSGRHTRRQRYRDGQSY